MSRELGDFATATNLRGVVFVEILNNPPEHRVELGPHPVSARSAVVDATGLNRFLQPDRRVSLQRVIAELAAQETRGIQDPLAKARAIYNYVIATMRLRQVRHRLGQRRCNMGLHRQAWQLHGFSLAVYWHDAGSPNSCPLRLDRWMPQKLGSIQIRRIISSGRTTTIACSLLSDGTSGSTHLSRAIRSTTSSILARWTESRSRWNPSSRSKTESTVATEALSALLAMPGRSASSQMCAAHRSRDDYP